MTVHSANTAKKAIQPASVRLPAMRLKLIRAITALVVGGPVLGSIVAIGLAVAYGVSPTALICFAATYAISTLGVTIGFHRHFTHRAFRTGPVMQTLFVILGSSAMQGPLLLWVATHRRHHQFSDGPGDPHSPHLVGDRALNGWAGLWHGHIGWMFSSEMTNAIRFAPDILRDRRIFNLQRHYLLWAAIFLIIPGIVGGLVIE